MADDMMNRFSAVDLRFIKTMFFWGPQAVTLVITTQIPIPIHSWEKFWKVLVLSDWTPLI